MYFNFSVFVFAVFALVIQTANAQIRPARIVSPAIQGSRVIVQDGQVINFAPGQPMPPGLVPNGQPPTAQGVAAPPANVRLEKLLQLTFDRRAAGYLKAWSEENLPEEADDTESNDNLNSEDQSVKPENEAGNKTNVAEINDLGESADGMPPQPPGFSERDAARLIRIEKEVTQFQADVVLNQWESVREFLARLPEEDAVKVYNHVLNSMMMAQINPPTDGNPESMMLFQQQQQATSMGIQDLPIVSPSDVLNLVDASPKEPTDEQLVKLSNMLTMSRTNGFSLDGFQEQLKTGTRYLGGEEPEKRLLAGKLLIKAGQSEFAADFLPDLDKAIENKEVDQLLLTVDYLEQLYAREGKAEVLEKNWGLVQTILAFEDLAAEKRKSFLKKAVELSTKVRDDLGAEWLKASFTEHPERGLQILSNMGINTANGILTFIQQPQERLNSLKLQNTAVESLLANAPELADNWKPTLNILLQNWMKEVDTSLKYYVNSSSRPSMQMDMYGNYFWSQNEYMDDSYRYQNQQIRPINVFELLKLKPGDQWQSLIDESLISEFNTKMAKLHLKNEEAEESFPYVETVCKREPKRGRALVNDFLESWISSHDPNTESRRRNPFIYMYGYDQKAEGIPLTRSKQQRNLADLKIWIERIRKLPIEPVDDKLLARAFTTCHSEAEVFRLEAFENVFGTIDLLEPETVAGIAHTMRENLSAKWRSVKLQEEANTKRKAPEIQKDVLEGYATALKLVDDSLIKSPESWQLMLAKACTYFDQNAYTNSIQKSSEFSKNRDQAFEYFKQATDLYRELAPTLDVAEHSVDAYQRWFYASLGACDVGQITHETVPDTKQHAQVRAALAELPGELAEIHMGKFANDLFTRMSPLKPQVKFRYLDGGFEIVGDHERAEEARKVYQYYRDLVTEIKLDIRIDGTDNVGHQQPFGVFVNLIHTPEIERESGGFAKYVQNQNQMQYAYNYGRPTEDYRTKFQEATSIALEEHFEVQSIIFEDPKSLKSREHSQGWRITPYAYVLLKARGPEVDKIPSLKIDFDFMDTSGYAVLPIESQLLPLGRNNPAGEMRPVKDLVITQTLDERRAAEGKLILEVKAEATGLVPELDQIVDLNIDGFKIVNVYDQSVVPTKFDETSNDIQIKSDRSWTVEMAAVGQTQPKQFSFGTALLPNSKTTFQRYDDADLKEVEQLVSLENTYAASTNWYWMMLPVAAGILVLFLCLFAVVMLVVRSAPRAQPRFAMPTDVNPFTVMGLLRDIDSNGRLKDHDKEELGQSIDRLEKYYFNKHNGEAPPELESIASKWLKKA